MVLKEHNNVIHNMSNNKRKLRFPFFLLIYVKIIKDYKNNVVNTVCRSVLFRGIKRSQVCKLKTTVKTLK